MKERYPKDPEVIRTTIQTDFHVEFSIIHNGTKDKSYKERVNFKTFDGCELCSPESGNSYRFTLEPDETKEILIK